MAQTNKLASEPPRKRTGPSWFLWAAIAATIAVGVVRLPGLWQAAWGLAKQQHPSITIRQGTIIGRMVDDGTFPEPLEAFMGIPYALPPVDELRFREAVPVPEGNGTLKAFYLGPRYGNREMPLA